MNNLGNLPTEVIGEVVHYVGHSDLYACSLINHHFHAVVNRILWRAFDVKNEVVFTQVMTGLVESSPPVGKLVRHVHLDPTTTDTRLLAFLKHVPYLEDLMMEDSSHITDTSLQHLPIYCPCLKKLVLTGKCILILPSVMTLAQHCSQLTALVLLSASGLPPSALLSLASCPLLKSLIINFDVEDGLDDYDDDDRRLPALDALANLQFLQCLKITLCSTHFAHHLLTTLSLHPAWLPALTDFLLDGCDTVTEQQAIAFMKAYPGLHTIALMEIELDDTYLEALASALPNIRHVGLHYSTDLTPLGIRRLIWNCPLLEWIDLLDCGMTLDDFPEANINCLDNDDDDDDEIVVVCLDEEAIDAIRDEEDEDDDDDDNEQEEEHDDDDDGSEGGGDTLLDMDELEWEDRLARWQLQDQVAHGDIRIFSDNDKKGFVVNGGKKKVENN